MVFRDVTDDRRAEEALRQSEERLRLMVASVHDYAIFLLDPSGRVATWNPGAEHMKGYRADEIIGTHYSTFFVPEEIDAGLPARELEDAARLGRYEVEGWRVRKDGSRFWANVVVSAVRNAAGELLGFTKVTRDLTERREAEEERIRLAQAQEALRLRDEFLSIASHELKTPLTAMQLQLQSLHDRLAPDPHLAPRIARAVRTGGRLADLIETLLDVSRIATGKLELRPERFDLVEVVREVVERLRDAATQAGCTLTFVSDDAVVGAWDRLRVEQIVTNLLANAFKYAPRTPVTIRVAGDGATATLEVQDQGPGIREVDLPRIFGRFERAARLGDGGLGLGLYVTRQVVEAHGGHVVALNAPGGGARIVVNLPIRPEPTAPERA
jgi:PAS domain S-box-containing protein